MEKPFQENLESLSEENSVGETTAEFAGEGSSEVEATEKLPSERGLIGFQCDVCAYPLVHNEEPRQNVLCDRCGKVHHLRPKSANLTLVFSLTALIFYFPANIFPFMTIELYGNRNSSTIWGGITSLATDGSWFLATIVFLASILIPFVKLVILFYLALTNDSGTHQREKTRLYHVVEAIGRWSMLDIFLLAVLVAIVKLGHFSTVEPEIGSALFALVVIFTLLASSSFDPKLIWKHIDETSN